MTFRIKTVTDKLGTYYKVQRSFLGVLWLDIYQYTSETTNWFYIGRKPVTSAMVFISRDKAQAYIDIQR